MFLRYSQVDLHIQAAYKLYNFCIIKYLTVFRLFRSAWEGYYIAISSTRE